MWNGIGWYGFIGPTTSTTDISLFGPLSGPANVGPDLGPNYLKGLSTDDNDM